MRTRLYELSVVRLDGCCVAYKRITLLISKGGYRREEKSRKHWSPFTMLLFSVTANLFFC